MIVAAAFKYSVMLAIHKVSKVSNRITDGVPFLFPSLSVAI